MRKPVVSVVIPAFNRSATIGRALASVRAQTFPDFEIVVVDDASVDDTVAACAAFEDSRLRIVRRDVNGGAAAARNTGILESTADLIAFLDSDDSWLPDKLARQVAAMSLPGAPEVGCTGVILHLLDHGEKRVKRLEQTSDWARRLAMDCDLSPGSTQIATRRIFGEIGLLDETLPRFEDWDWLLRYTRRHAIGAIPDPLAEIYNRRARLGETVERSAALFQRKHQSVFRSLPASDRRDALMNLWLQAANTYAFERRFWRAIPPLIKAFRHHPLRTTQRFFGGAIRYGLQSGKSSELT